MMSQDKRVFYLFLGLHSLLIGVFPFYVPVYLWQSGIELPQICLLIATTGVGFQVGLWSWDRLRLYFSLNSLFLIALLLFFLLLFSVMIVSHTIASALCLALTYGLYNSFFWTTQRALFVEVIDRERSGQAYGNFQLFVFAALQIGIMSGGWLLQYSSFEWLIAFCAVIAIAGSTILYNSRPIYPRALQQTPSLNWQTVASFKDNNRSRTMFVVDGCFLFLESYFWVISLFLLAHESFTRLGVVVIVLAAVFGGLFFVLKNTIDQLGRQQMFVLAVMLYTASWVIRALVADDYSLLTLFVLLVLITFATSFFRLALNKRFYDLAAENGLHRYLVIKSYYSQLSLIASFLLIALLASYIQNDDSTLKITYLIGACLAPIYLLYGARRYRD